jgi:hypothetical protein
MTQYDACVKILRTDNGTEYVNKNFDEYLSSFGIVHQTTCPGTSEQNGLAERKNRHLLEVTRCLMMNMNVPKYLWAEAVMTASYLINRMPTRVLDYKTPIECLTGKTTYVVPPKVFGCVCFVRDHRPSTGKLDPRALKCIFVGYSGTQKGYKCWCPTEKRMFVSMDVTFRENETFYGESPDLTNVFPNLFTDDASVLRHETGEEGASIQVTSEDVIVGVIPRYVSNDNQEKNLAEAHQDPRQGEELELLGEEPTDTEIITDQENPEGISVVPDIDHAPSTSDTGNLMSSYDDLDVPIALRKPLRTTTGKLPSKFSSYDMSNHVSYSSIGPTYKAFIAALDSTIPIPHDWQEAKKYPQWRAAMLEEMSALDKNDTWELSTLPMGKKAVGCKWVFTIKHTPDGKIERYKARLVAKGYSQTYGVDYDETFAPVAKMNTIKTLISVAANQRWKLFQLDVKNAFLHGDLQEEVYMEIPPGFNTRETEGRVCKLKKSLYGLMLFSRTFTFSETNWFSINLVLNR